MKLRGPLIRYTNERGEPHAGSLARAGGRAMIESVFTVLFVLLGLGLAILLVVLVPLMLLGALFKVLFALILLPFKLLRAAFGVVGGIALGLGKGLLGLVAVLAAGALLIGGILFLPLLLLGLFVGAIWLVARLFQPRTA